jgi:hypothetical protein
MFVCSCDRGSVAVLGYVAVIGEFVHAGMPWHVRMGAEGHPGGPAEALRHE